MPHNKRFKLIQRKSAPLNLSKRYALKEEQYE